MSLRTGGRKSRIASRSAPLASAMKPVHPGETGGHYKPLINKDIEAIVENCFQILEQIGFEQATPHCIDVCTRQGAILGADGRLRMPRKLVQEVIKTSNKNVILYGQDPAHDLNLSGSRVHFSTAGAAVMIMDSVSQTHRESQAQDLFDMARIVDCCEHIHMFHRTCVLRDIKDNFAMDLNTTYNTIMGTSKHVGSSWSNVQHLEQTLKLLHIVAGGEQAWRERPFISQASCFVVPPMRFATEALECLRVSVENGMPVLLLSAGQAGATSPPCLAGAVSQAWAEALGGLVYVNSISPGAPAILGTWPFVSDLRSGSMSGGAPEQAIMSAACAQIGQYFDLPVGTGSGMSDANEPNFQAGAEHASNAAVVALSGANLVYEAAGMYSSLLSVCPESLLLDNDILGACMRMVKGITVNEDTLAFDLIKDVCLNNKGHYLDSKQTLSVMQSEYIYPQLCTRLSPGDWMDAGKPDPLALAVKRKEEILKNHFPKHISDEIDDRIRAEFPIYLSRESIGRDVLPT